MGVSGWRNSQAASAKHMVTKQLMSVLVPKAELIDVC
jgi:hypothetical protein